jgi:hypothetical protein
MTTFKYKTLHARWQFSNTRRHIPDNFEIQDAAYQMTTSKYKTPHTRWQLSNTRRRIPDDNFQINNFLYKKFFSLFYFYARKIFSSWYSNYNIPTASEWWLRYAIIDRAIVVRFPAGSKYFLFSSVRNVSWAIRQHIKRVKKIKVTLEQVTKTQRGNRCTALLFL